MGEACFCLTSPSVASAVETSRASRAASGLLRIPSAAPDGPLEPHSPQLLFPFLLTKLPKNPPHSFTYNSEDLKGLNFSFPIQAHHILEIWAETLRPNIEQDRGPAQRLPQASYGTACSSSTHQSSLIKAVRLNGRIQISPNLSPFLGPCVACLPS